MFTPAVGLNSGVLFSVKLITPDLTPVTQGSSVSSVFEGERDGEGEGERHTEKETDRENFIILMC